ncbi:hypothetical protein [Pseudoalteromonas rhizosphaerae]|uniref:hypothetical protein n=1 Tax=Pseudoalteromonas rhizosphaerae TaxID=2518973 RepID=UPI00384FC102
MNLHSLRHNKTLLKYLMVLLLLFSVFSQWHSTVHAVQSSTECQLCISSFDFDDLISPTTSIFEPESNRYSAVLALHSPQFSATVAFSGNRDPPNTL